MRNNRSRQQIVGLLAPGLLIATAIVAGGSLAQSQETTEDTASISTSQAPQNSEADQTGVSTADPSVTTSAQVTASSQADSPEATLDIPATARPSLDYEPTESISEDRSVSFPVDI